MQASKFLRSKKVLSETICLGLAFMFLVFTGTPAIAQVGTTTVSPVVPMELPVEVEIELAPAASLKQAPLWKELIQLLRFPNAHEQDPQVYPPATVADPNARLTTAPIVRRPAFRQPGDPRGPNLSALKIWSPGYNFLTAQPLRLRTSDGEPSWDQPGPLFDNNEIVPVDAFNVPTAVRTPIGHLVACPNIPAYQSVAVPAGFCTGQPEGSLVVFNTSGSGVIPPTGTVVAVSAYVGGVLQELNGTSTTATTAVVPPLGIPVNEEHFFRDPADTAGVPGPLLSLIGRPAAEILGKALFWDMQVGSDGVQACGSCHFHAGVDNRTRNQRNVNITGTGENVANLSALAVSNTTSFNSEVAAGDFPFHKRFNPQVAGDGTDPALVKSDSNDVMSSMGVLKFKQFVDIPTPGGGTGGTAFIQVPGTVKPLAGDIGNVAPDPVLANQGFRRVEPRNTPTFHGAAFNFDNFWDGRARFNFNGGNVFGPADPQFHIFVNNGTTTGAINGLPNPADNTLPLDQWAAAPGDPTVPARIKFSSLASQATGPPLSNFEMSFDGRSWAKIGKKLLQAGVTPLANQMVSPTDSVLGPYSNVANPGINLSYPQLIQLAFNPRLWANTNQHLNGAPDPTDPFDGYSLSIAGGAVDPANTNQFTQMEANFSLLFGLAVQAYEELTIPDDSPFDRFMDANPLAANAIGQPGEQRVLFPTLIPGLVGGGVTLVPGFGPEEILGFDIFAGGNLTAALPPGPVGLPGGPGNRNPQYTIAGANGPVTIAVGSNPFARTARCMLCHLGPEQTDHSINISHGLLKGDAEFEAPSPPFVPDPDQIFAADPVFGFILPAPEPPGAMRVVPGLILAEEIAGAAQDAVEVEPRNFVTFDNPATPWDDRVVAQPAFFAYGDQGIYNVGVRPIAEDIGRGGNDPFGFPFSLSALALMDIGQPGFVPCDGTITNCVMTNIDPLNLAAAFEETGEGLPFPGTALTLQSINPGFEKDPINPSFPAYLSPWVNRLPAGELHPQIDEMAFAPNTITPPTGGPALEFAEFMFGADVHCGLYDPATFGNGPPNFGWGPPASTDNVCPNNQSTVGNNYDVVLHGTWPVPNRVLKNGAFKAPSLRNVELTGPYFHTGSYLTLRQVVDFYMRGGDFPITNGQSRDPHILDIEEQAFGFGRTTGADLGVVNVSIDGNGALCTPGTPGCITYNGNIADALPDTAFRYDAMPDTDHPVTPEYLTQEEAKDALVRFLISLTDERVKFDRAPFDHPEIFVPVDGLAPANTLGRANLTTLSSCSAATPCTLPGPDELLGTSDDLIVTAPVFRQVAAVGAAGIATPLSNFLNISSNFADKGSGRSHFDSITTSPLALLGSDFSGDGFSDIIWRNMTTGQVQIWTMNGTTVASNLSPATVSDLNWEIKGAADFNGNGTADILWWDKTSGQVNIWTIAGINPTIVSNISPFTVSDLNWEIKSVGDFNGDGQGDILWWNKTSGQVNIWLMNGTTIASNGSPFTVSDLNWLVKGVGDFNADGLTDILWWNNVNGQVQIWLMNGTTIVSNASPATVSDLNWEIEGVGDFNGDSQGDILWRNKTTGQVNIWLMNGTTIVSNASPATVSDLNWKIEGVDHYNGDFFADILWRHAVSGQVQIWLMNGTTITTNASPATVSDLSWEILQTEF